MKKMTILCSSLVFVGLCVVAACSSNAVEAPDVTRIETTTCVETTTLYTTRMTTTPMTTKCTTSCTTTTPATTTTCAITTTVATTTTEVRTVTETEAIPETVAETEPYVEPVVEDIPETEATVQETETEYNPTPEPIAVVYCDPTDREYLSQLVAHEAGSDWISTYNKACVVAVVINRVNSSSFPNTVYDVLTQPGQFSGFWFGYSPSQSCYDAVDYYFAHTNEFGNILYFYGDGYQNYFY